MKKTGLGYGSFPYPAICFRHKMKTQQALRSAQSAEWIVELFAENGDMEAAENMRLLIEERLIAAGKRAAPHLPAAFALSMACFRLAL